MYVTRFIERGVVTTNTMAYLFRFGYLLLVAPNTEKLLEKTGLFEEKWTLGNKSTTDGWVSTE